MTFLIEQGSIPSITVIPEESYQQVADKFFLDFFEFSRKTELGECE